MAVSKRFATYVFQTLQTVEDAAQWSEVQWQAFFTIEEGKQKELNKAKKLGLAPKMSAVDIQIEKVKAKAAKAHLDLLTMSQKTPEQLQAEAQMAVDIAAAKKAKKQAESKAAYDNMSEEEKAEFKEAAELKKQAKLDKAKKTREAKKAAEAAAATATTATSSTIPDDEAVKVAKQEKKEKKEKKDTKKKKKEVEAAAAEENKKDDEDGSDLEE
mgnify:CR=1 FL=1